MLCSCHLEQLFILSKFQVVPFPVFSLNFSQVRYDELIYPRNILFKLRKQMLFFVVFFSISRQSRIDRYFLIWWVVWKKEGRNAIVIFAELTIGSEKLSWGWLVDWLIVCLFNRLIDRGDRDKSAGKASVPGCCAQLLQFLSFHKQRIKCRAAELKGSKYVGWIDEQMNKQTNHLSTYQGRYLKPPLDITQFLSMKEYFIFIRSLQTVSELVIQRAKNCLQSCRER